MNPLRTLFVALSRTPPAIMLTVIVGLAIATTVMVTGYLNRQESDYKQRLSEINAAAQATGVIVYTKRDIAEGEVIPSDALEEKQIAQSKIPQDSLSAAANAVGRRAKYGMPAGQIVSFHALAPFGAPQGFESRLKVGMRAVTFAVDTTSGVAGFVAPRSHVDIMATAGSGGDTKVAAVLSNVEVIAAGQTYERSNAQGSTGYNSVTVAVAPQDTQKLIKAIAASKLYLALRSDDDNIPVATMDVVNLYPRPLPQSINLARVPEPPASAIVPATTTPGIEQAALITPETHAVELWSGDQKEIISVSK